ncbi:MAG: hypothetical protein HN842_07145 [Gammaproteobacteria bacterium]|jgi:hypothetical protein|nr:hypothetical protein [Gammaproteobacteria bacterium]MBT7307975.1 hypothetical protein [Gammaproteobacteria bacterium]
MKSVKVAKGGHRLLLWVILAWPFSLYSAEQESSRFVPVGTPADLQYAAQLWSAMVEEKIEGEGRKSNPPFFGGARPHGEILELSDQNLRVGSHTGFIVVKRNYGQAGVADVRGRVTVERVTQNRAKFLDSITVMYQRESGYDDLHQNWFWAKFRPDGSLFRKRIEGRETALAGRLLKGKQREDNAGCIYCHSAAGGGDYIFYPEITSRRSH